MASKRIFVGLFLPASAARELHTTVRGLLTGAGFRFVPPDEIHLTLRFLGDTEDAAIEEIRSALEGRLAGLCAPSLRIATTGAFPESGAARILWAGIEEDPGTEGRLAVRWRPLEVRLVESRPGQSGPARFPVIASFPLLPDSA